MGNGTVAQITKEHFVDDTTRQIFLTRMERKLALKQAIADDFHRQQHNKIYQWAKWLEVKLA